MKGCLQKPLSLASDRLLLSHKVAYYRSLEALVRVGIPVHQAFGILDAQGTPPLLRSASAQVMRLLASGSSLNEAMAKFPRVFTRTEVCVCQIGCASGTLPHCLGTLSEIYQKEDESKRELRASLAQPAITLVVCAVAITFLPPLMFKPIFHLLKDSEVSLPLISSLLLAWSDLIRSPFFWLALVLLFILSLRLGQRLGAAKLRLHKEQIGLSVPVLACYLKAHSVSRFAHMLSLLAQVGIALEQALPLAAESSDSPLIEARAHSAVLAIRSGSTLAECFKSSEFTPVFTASMRAGEESGLVSEAMESACTLLELETDYRRSLLMGSLGPVVTLLVGSLVGLINLALLLPIIRYVGSL